MIKNKKYRDPFKGMSFKGKPVSREEYIAAYDGYVNRCSGMVEGDYHDTGNKIN